MKNLKMFLLVVVAFIIGLNFQTISSNLKKDFIHANHVQYCHDLYQVRMQACPFYYSDIKNYNK